MRNFTDEHKQRRQQQIANLLRQELFDILRREVKDPRVRQLTVTAVDLKPDLKSAFILVCKFTETLDEEVTPEQQDDLLEGLRSANHFIYQSLKKRLKMKVVPHLKFSYDVGLIAGSRMASYIHGVCEADKVSGAVK